MYTEDIEYFTGSSHVAPFSDESGVPNAWKAYTNSEMPIRLANVSNDISPLADLMPETHTRLLSTVREAFLYSDASKGILRVLNKIVEDDEKLYSYISKAPVTKQKAAEKYPLFVRNAPRSFVDFYTEHFDGLFDASLAGGFLPLSEMATLAESIDDYVDYPWYGKAKNMSRLEDILLVFSNGGGGYLYLDLRQDQSSRPDPVCMLIMTDPGEPMEFVPFWEYLDAWTSIAMGA
ncbi:SMI1/KNR4 family protein [Phyllobacterium sp. 21LDTY02-6]|uniref:SMI1/KNR4 family protein n=1 Tax=Phyllobacterium sp. 21LDTY02-6 TaxID=2944903 RepID=UPI00208E273D|nr:SMI1/KNR4 family protein [Phyllobacterium sp. 21LDTY02-6]MCO4319187.1 SMI1/KNR4 family protein [Phyllobacterium sp. 21LDTY02-6]